MQTPAFVATKTARSWKLRRLIFVAAAIAAFLCPLATFAQCNTSWQGGASGDWSVAGNWTSGVPANNITCITTAHSAVTLDVNGTTSFLTIGSTDSLSIGNGLSLTVTGNQITNNGTINLLGTGSPTSLVLNGEVELFGTGKLILSNNSQNLITGSGTLLNFSTIEGAGSIGNGNGQSSIENRGTISANGPAGSTLTIDVGGGNAGFFNECKCGGSRPSGVLAVSRGDTLNIDGNFNNFFDGGLSGGIYNVTGTLEFAAGTTGIVSLSGSINLNGPNAKILNTSENNSNALSGFNSLSDPNFSEFGLAGGAQFTTGGNFGVSGTLNIGSGSKFSVGKNGAFDLTNFISNTSTLMFGAYKLTGTGQIQFNNGGDSSDIVNNDAIITLAGASTTSSFIDQNGKNALANLADNLVSGSLILSTGRPFTTSGSFTNAGIVDIQKANGTAMIIGGAGSYSQTGGSTTVNEMLIASGGVNVSGGSVFGIGTITGNIDLTGGLLSPGMVTRNAGELTVKGTYTQSGAGVLDVDLGGATAGTQYDVLNVTGAASLGGTLNVDLINGFTFKPTVGETFDIIDYTSETGTFTTVNLPKLTGGDTWSISYNATSVVLTVDGPGSARANPGLVSGVPAKRVSRGLMAGVSGDGAREPVAILSRAACFGARMMMMISAAGGAETLAAIATGGERRVSATAGGGSGAVHNNILVHNNIMGATRAISTARGGASRETSAPAAAMARIYVCAYLPSGVGHAMGCN